MLHSLAHAIRNAAPMTTVALAAALVAGTSARADHIDGHDDCDPTFPMPIPGQSDFTGGLLFVTLIGPEGDTVVHETTFDVTFRSVSGIDPSTIEIEVSMVVDGATASTIVTGADLGFVDMIGTQTGTLTTHVFDGVVDAGGFFPHAIVNLDIIAVGGTGYFLDSFITFDVDPVGPCCPADLDGSASVGFTDLNRMLSAWGPCAGCVEDLDGDGNVGFTDLSTLLSAWGDCT